MPNLSFSQWISNARSAGYPQDLEAKYGFLIAQLSSMIVLIWLPKAQSTMQILLPRAQKQRTPSPKSPTRRSNLLSKKLNRLNHSYRSKKELHPRKKVGIVFYINFCWYYQMELMNSRGRCPSCRPTSQRCFACQSEQKGSKISSHWVR